MKESELNISDRRMLELAGFLKEEESISMKAFCDSIGVHKQNIRNIRLGKQHFTLDQIRNACQVYGRDANYMIGVTDKQTSPTPVNTKKIPVPTVNRKVNRISKKAPVLNRSKK